MISVEAEKAHRGHSDKNAICGLVQGGALLLHGGGYRESLPNGKYRADYYHNRPVVRRGLLRQGDSVYDFLHGDELISLMSGTMRGGVSLGSGVAGSGAGDVLQGKL